MRHDTKDVLNVANLCLEAKDKIIGFDIAGPELNFPPSLFKESFKKVKELGVNITIHAGEGDGVNSIIDALDNGAMRIGHGAVSYTHLRAHRDVEESRMPSSA